MDYLTDAPAEGVADDGLVDRALGTDGMVEFPSGGVTAAGITPRRLLAGARVDTWADAYDVFSDHGFRVHPDAAGFPDTVRLCARTEAGTALIVSCVEGELSLAEFDDVPSAATWVGVDPASDGTRFAFQL